MEGFSDSAATPVTSSASEHKPDPACPRCKGVGYYLLDVPIDHPNFGALMTCECKQEEFDQRAAEERRRLSNLEHFVNKTFETFDENVEGVERAYRRAREFAERFPDEDYPIKWLILIGNYGCGKTHLAAAVANHALRHLRVLFANVPDLLDHLRSTFGPTSEVGYDTRFETIRDIPLLVLDDLGTESTTPWAREKLYQIINHRYNNKLPTVITSNRDPESSIEPRIFSRIADRALCGEITTLNASDYRKLSMDQRKLKRKRP